MTVSRFLKAGCLDRLQVTVSPLIIGSGRPAIVLPEVTSLTEGLRPARPPFRFRRRHHVRVPLPWMSGHSGLRRPGRGEVRSAPGRNPNDGEVAIRALASGVSRGTEALVFQGRVPESQYAIMRCPFQAGDFPGPVKYGYALRWQSGRRWRAGILSASASGSLCRAR